MALAVGAVVACNHAPPAAGPSPVATAPSRVTPPTPRPIPAWVDPQLVGTLLLVGPDGEVKHWAGGPFHHCIAQEVDREVVDPVITAMTERTGISRTESGPCNVEWFADYGRAAHSNAELHGTETEITSARVFLYDRAAATARHESGHVLGFGHSPRPQDLMNVNASPRVTDFSPDELAVLAWIYERR